MAVAVAAGLIIAPSWPVPGSAIAQPPAIVTATALGQLVAIIIELAGQVATAAALLMRPVAAASSAHHHRSRTQAGSWLPFPHSCRRRSKPRPPCASGIRVA